AAGAKEELGGLRSACTESLVLEGALAAHGWRSGGGGACGEGGGRPGGPGSTGRPHRADGGTGRRSRSTTTRPGGSRRRVRRHCDGPIGCGRLRRTRIFGKSEDARVRYPLGTGRAGWRHSANGVGWRLTHHRGRTGDRPGRRGGTHAIARIAAVW